MNMKVVDPPAPEPVFRYHNPPRSGNVMPRVMNRTLKEACGTNNCT